jgi:hypothetical protein
MVAAHYPTGGATHTTQHEAPFEEGERQTVWSCSRWIRILSQVSMPESSQGKDTAQSRAGRVCMSAQCTCWSFAGDGAAAGKQWPAAWHRQWV